MGLVPGDRLGPYEILSRVGAGGMGEVYKARDARLDRVVAIKDLSPRSLANVSSGKRGRLRRSIIPTSARSTMWDPTTW